jgi:uncharacterized membrane protein YjfL (UPF0719 family)
MDPTTPLKIGLAIGTTLLLLVLLAIVERGVAKDLVAGNAAHRLVRVGQVVAVFAIAAASVDNGVSNGDAAHSAIWSLGAALLGLVLLLVTGKLGVRLLLSSRLTAELDRGNEAAGLAAGAQYVAAGIVTSAALAGNDPKSIGLSIAFFVLGQITLQLTIALFRALTTYDDAEQIAGENIAAAVSYAGLAIAVAIVVARAVEGDFVSWQISLRGYGMVLLSLAAFYPVRQIFVETLLMRAPLKFRGGKLDAAIAGERSVGLAALEAASYLATALSIARLA